MVTLLPLLPPIQSDKVNTMATRHKSSNTKSRRSSSVTKRSFLSRPSLAELRAMGRKLRDKCPRQSHADWNPPNDRPDPVAFVKESDKGRIAQLVPVRHGRMLQTPFTFYRGAALNMAADLAKTPATGLRVQACGDCHLLNFGAFATPERRDHFRHQRSG